METEPIKLELVIAEQQKEQQLSATTGEELLASFNGLFDEAYQLIQQASKVTVTDATQLDEMARSRELRLALKKVRTCGDKKREHLKAEGLRRNSAIQGVFNVLKYMVEPIEETLLAQEEFAARRQAERRAALKSEREAALAPLGVDTSVYVLEAMEQEDFEQLLENLTARHEARIEAEKKSEADRLAKIEAERQEQERIRADNERLRLENQRIEREKREERERAQQERQEAELKAAKERQEAEQKAAEAKAAADKERAEAAAKLKAEQAESARKIAEAGAAAKRERDRIEEERKAERLKAEKEAQEKLRQAHEAQLRAEKEAQDIRDAERERLKLEAEWLEAESEKKRKADCAPDRDKLLALANVIGELRVPEFSTKDFLRWSERISNLLYNLEKELKQIANSI